MRSRKQQGFTLIEISIVLVVIGLIIGGIVAGRSLIRNSHLQSIVTDTTRYINAVLQFQKQYQALPGDMATASSNWGLNANCASNGVGSNATQTCNGNGDGQIYNFNISANATNSQERYLVWQHLVNAGLITGTFSGVSGSTSNNAYSITGQNVPGSPLYGAGYDLFYLGNQSGSANFYNRNYGHILYFGAAIASSVNQGPVISTVEAYSVDGKIDDGLPGSGSVMSPPQGAANAGSCATGAYNAASGSTYDLTVTASQSCALIFVTGF